MLWKIRNIYKSPKQKESMHQNVIHLLQTLGFEEREAKIYLYLLKNKGSSALQIAKGALIDRTTCYDLLEKLIQRGLVSFAAHNGARRFYALRSEDLLAYFKDKYASLQHFLPDLKQIENDTSASFQCEIFQGLEGMKTPLKELVESGADHCVINIRKEFEEILDYYNDHFILRLDKVRARERGIVPTGAQFKRLRKGAYRTIHKKFLSSSVTTLIYEATVIFLVWAEPYFALCITNREFARSQQEYFELLWNLAKKT